MEKAGRWLPATAPVRSLARIPPIRIHYRWLSHHMRLAQTQDDGRAFFAEKQSSVISQEVLSHRCRHPIPQHAPGAFVFASLSSAISALHHNGGGAQCHWTQKPCSDAIGLRPSSCACCQLSNVSNRLSALGLGPLTTEGSSLTTSSIGNRKSKIENASISIGPILLREYISPRRCHERGIRQYATSLSRIAGLESVTQELEPYEVPHLSWDYGGGDVGVCQTRI